MTASGADRDERCANMRNMTGEPNAVREWAWLIEAFADCGLDGGRLLTNAMGQVEFDLDLGDGWGATVTTPTGDLGDFDPQHDTLVVRVWGGDRQHPSFKEGYIVEWYAAHDTPPHVPALVAPLLRRLKR